MKLKNLLISILALGLIGLAACTTQAAAPTQAAIVMTDGLGRQVSLDAPAEKIVSLAPSNTEILFAIGAGPQMIGRDSFSNYPPEALELAEIGGVRSTTLEEITRLQPDLVLAAKINAPELISSLEELGLTVYYLDNPHDMEGLFTNLQIVAELTGRQAETEELVESLRQRVEKAKSVADSVPERPKVFYELDGTDPAKPWTSGPDTFIDMLIDMAGGQNIGAVLSSEWAQISQEELIVQNPDIILLGDAAYGVTPESVAERPGWAAIKAVQEGRILPFNDDLVSRPGPRLVEALEELVKVLHLELAGQIE